MTRSRVTSSIVNEGSIVFGTVEHSIISTGVRVAEGARVTNSVVMPFAVIGEGAVVDHAIIGQHTNIMAGAQVIGSEGAIAVTGEDELVTPESEARKAAV